MHELSITRHIAAPPEKVWNIMIERMAEWWCPVPWRAEMTALDRRAGGRWLTTMFGPEGEEHTHDGIILEWTEGRRFIGTDAIRIDPDSGDPVPDGPFMMGIWELQPEGKGTRYTARACHWSEETRKQHEDMGFADGWGACADQLVALCEEKKDA